MGANGVWMANDPYNGTTPGRAIRGCDRSVIDQSTPEWHSVGPDQATPTLNFMYDTRDRRAFYVFPSQPASAANQQLIEVIYSAPPAEISDVGDVIGLDDVYQPALLSYVLHRALCQGPAQRDEQRAAIGCLLPAVRDDADGPEVGRPKVAAEAAAKTFRRVIYGSPQ